MHTVRPDSSTQQLAEVLMERRQLRYEAQQALLKLQLAKEALKACRLASEMRARIATRQGSPANSQRGAQEGASFG